MPILNTATLRVGATLVSAAFVGTVDVLDSPSFYADYTKSIVPIKGTGSPTFARASAGTVTDHDGVSRVVAINEVALTGSRRVKNFVAGSEDTTNIRSISGCTQSIDAADYPVGATQSIAVSVSSASWAVQKQCYAFNGDGCASVFLKGVGSSVGKTLYASIFANGGGGSGQVYPIMLTANWQRVLLKRINTGATVDLFINFYTSISEAPVGAGDVFKWSALQLEDVSGAVAKRAGEYVSRGRLAAPFHGAGIDGSKYFNERIQKNDFVAIGDSFTNGEHFPNAMAAKANAGVTIKGVSGHTLVQMQARFAADVLAYSPRVVLIQGGINDFITSPTTDPNAAMRVAVQQMTEAAVSAGIIPILTNTLPWSTYIGWTATKQGWQDSYHAWLQGYCAANGVELYDMYAYLSDPANPGALNPAWAAGDNLHLTQYGQQRMGYDMAHLVYFDTQTPILDSTAVGVASAGCTLSYPLPGNFSDTEGSAYAEITTSSWSAGTIIGNGTNGPIKLSASNSGAVATDGTNTASGPAGTPSGTIKVAVRWGAGKMRVAVNGALGSESNYDGGFNLSNMAILSGASGTVRHVKVWAKAKSDAELVAMTG